MTLKKYHIYLATILCLLFMFATLLYILFKEYYREKPISVKDRCIHIARVLDGIRYAVEGSSIFISEEQMQKLRQKRPIGRELYCYCLSEHEQNISWRYIILPIITQGRPDLNIWKKWDSYENTESLLVYFHSLQLTKIKSANFNELVVNSEKRFDTKNVMREYCYAKPYTYYKSVLDEKTNVLAIKGTNTFWDTNFNDCEKQINLDDTIPDELLMLIEIGKSDIHWAEPYDVDIEDLKNNCPSERYQPGIDHDNAGFIIIFWDGKIFYLKKETPLSLLAEFADKTNCRLRTREEAFHQYIIDTY